MYVIFTTLLPFVVLASVFDRIMQDDMRLSIASYISKGSNISVVNFETSIISSAIGGFVNSKGALSAKRVVVYTSVGYTLFYAPMVIWLVRSGEFSETPGYTSVGSAIILIFGMLPFCVYASLPSDYFSIAITKWLFYKENYPMWKLPLVWVIDIVLSLTIPVIPMAVLYNIGSQAVYGDVGGVSGSRWGMLFAITLLSSSILSILISIFQLLAIIGGMIMRITVGPIAMSSKLATKLFKLQDYPLTAIFAFWLMVALIGRQIYLFIRYLTG